MSLQTFEQQQHYPVLQHCCVFNYHRRDGGVFKNLHLVAHFQMYAFSVAKTQNVV